MSAYCCIKLDLFINSTVILQIWLKKVTMCRMKIICWIWGFWCGNYQTSLLQPHSWVLSKSFLIFALIHQWNPPIYPRVLQSQRTHRLYISLSIFFGRIFFTTVISAWKLQLNHNTMSRSPTIASLPDVQKVITFLYSCTKSYTCTHWA